MKTVEYNTGSASSVVAWGLCKRRGVSSIYVTLNSRVRGYTMRCMRCGYIHEEGATKYFDWDVRESRRDWETIFPDVVFDYRFCEKCKCNTFTVTAYIEVEIV